MIDAESILDRGRIDLRCHAAVVGEPSAVDAGSLAVVDQLDGCASGDFAFSTGDKDPELSTVTGEAFLERAADGGSDAARMPVESQDAAESLKPVRVRQSSQELRASVLQHHHLRNGGCELDHSVEQPARRLAAVEWESRATGTLGHDEN